jgi:OOP family OmpA-OmpF porin
VNDTPEIGERVTPVRITVDGTYAKVYVNEKRVANVPNASIPRSSEIWIENIYSGSAESPLYLGAIRIAEGGVDLYDRLAADGRVATRGVLFDVNSARIRPESTPTLKEMGEMLSAHPDLRIRIEGHTDSIGDDAANLALSLDRAGAVRDFLVESFGVDASRLEVEGLGETVPVDDNGTPEGRQNNRRVELVRLGG